MSTSNGSTATPPPAPSRATRVLARDIAVPVACMLWGRAAGRCEVAGCNKPLWRSPVTGAQVNIGERAHIYAFSPGGPRAKATIGRRRLNDLTNLILVCGDCHKEIDKKGTRIRYPAELLRRMKVDHERRVERVTAIDQNRKSHVILYGANVGDHSTTLSEPEAARALFAERYYPAEDHAIRLGLLNGSERDSDARYWANQEAELERKFAQLVQPRLAHGELSHISVFALAPQPLLVRLGTLLTDLPEVAVYQRHREPQTWEWQNDAPDKFRFVLTKPRSSKGRPALVLALSASVTPDRISAAVGKDVSIWQMSVAQPHNDFLRSRDQLAGFRRAVRPLLDQIKRIHGQSTLLHVLLVAPVAISVEFGRVRQPKADMPWRLYDQVNARGGFIPAIDIPGKQRA